MSEPAYTLARCHYCSRPVDPTSRTTYRRILGWEPTHPGLLADFDAGDYFTTPSPHG